jgi:pyrroloquinoline quinone biosynthesis protein E
LREFPEQLSADDWGRVFREAAALGAVHCGITGGEPTTRRDLPEIVRGASEAGLYTHLVTAALPIDAEGLTGLREAGLRSVQVSLQDTEASGSDEIAGTKCFDRKLAFAREVRSQGLPLTLNVVLHRRNLGHVRELIEIARTLDADRLELANAQYQGWALVNRAALLPTREALEAAAKVVAEEQSRSPRPEILFVLPDYFRGRALPCHGAAELPLDFWNVREHDLAACWQDAPGMNAFRGDAWMQEPCRSCPERSRDFGGCRCQAFALTGDAAATDPTCTLAPAHAEIEAAHETPPEEGWRYREP